MAFLDLALCYSQGIHVEKDEIVAKKYYWLAADLGKSVAVLYD